MTQSFLRSGLMTALVVVIAGCSKPDPNALERSDATALVQAKIDGQPPYEGKYHLAPDAFTEGVTQGYWNNRGGLFPRGDEISDGVDWTFFRPKEPPHYTVVLTGVTDQPYSPGFKRIEFTISTDFVTGPPRRFIVSGYSGLAMAQRYDDGWRIQGVSFSPNKERLTLSAADQASMTQELATEAAMQAQANAAQAEQAAKFDAVLAESRTARKPDKSFHCDTVIGDRRIAIDVSVNDVHVVKVGKTFDRTGNGGVTGTSTYPYGHIPSLKVEGDWLMFEQPNAGSGTHFMYFYPQLCSNYAAVEAAVRKSRDSWWAQFSQVGAQQ